MKAITMTLGTIVALIILLMTLVAVAFFFRGQLAESGWLADQMSKDVNDTGAGIDLNPEKIFCNPEDGDYYECQDGTGGPLGGPYEYHGDVVDPYVECLADDCEVSVAGGGLGGKCKCIRSE